MLPKLHLLKNWPPSILGGGGCGPRKLDQHRDHVMYSTVYESRKYFKIYFFRDVIGHNGQTNQPEFCMTEFESTEEEIPGKGKV